LTRAALRRAMLVVGMNPESFWGTLADPQCMVWPTPAEARNIRPPGPDRLTFRSVVEAVGAELGSLVGGSLFGLYPSRLTVSVATRTLGAPSLYETSRFVKHALLDTEESPVQRAVLTPTVMPSSVPGKVLLDWSEPLRNLVETTGVQPAWLELSVVFDPEYADYAPFPIVAVFPANVGSEVIELSDVLSPTIYVGQRGPITPTIDRVAQFAVTAVWGVTVNVNGRWVAVDDLCTTTPTLYALHGVERPDIWMPMVLADYPESACAGCFASVDIAWWRQRTENGIPLQSPLGSSRGRVEAWHKLQQLISY